MAYRFPSTAHRDRKDMREPKVAFCEALRTGISRKTAASLAGVGYEVAQGWMERKDDFALECEIAESSALGIYESVVLEKARSDPYLALKILQARHPEWRREERRDVFKQAEILALAIQLLSGAELDAIAAEMPQREAEYQVIDD